MVAGGLDIIGAAEPLGRTPRRRKPEQTVLYQVLAQHLQTFLENVEAAGRSVPGFVKRELFKFLRCGIAANGFVRVRCPRCKRDEGAPSN